MKKALFTLCLISAALRASAQTYSIDWHSIDGGGGTQDALQLCRRLRARFDEAFVPTLFTAEDETADTCRAALDSGAAVTSDWNEFRARIERDVFGR